MKYFFAALLLITFLYRGGADAQALLSRPEAEEVFTVVEDMPIPWFYRTECLDAAPASRQDCYMERLQQWLSSRLVYPDAAVQNRTEGEVIARFVVDRTGAIRDVEVLRDIGDGCGGAAVRALGAMPDWVPGRQRGVAVPVRYTLPVRFELKK